MLKFQNALVLIRASHTFGFGLALRGWGGRGGVGGSSYSLAVLGSAQQVLLISAVELHPETSVNMCVCVSADGEHGDLRISLKGDFEREISYFG